MLQYRRLVYKHLWWFIVLIYCKFS